MTEQPPRPDEEVSTPNAAPPEDVPEAPSDAGSMLTRARGMLGHLRREPSESAPAEPPAVSATPPPPVLSRDDTPPPPAPLVTPPTALPPSPMLPPAPEPAVPSAAPDAAPDIAAEREEPVAVSYQEFEEEPEPLRHATPISAHLVVLGALATVVIMGFLLTEPSPRWLLLIGATAAVFGLDGTLRHTWRRPFEAGAESAPYLFVPALYLMAVPVLIEHNVGGMLVLPVGLLAGAGFGALAWAEVASVRTSSIEYPLARLITTASTYLTGFAIFSLSYVFEPGLPTALLAVGIAATMLSVEVLREGEVDPWETLGFSLLTGTILAETRWLLYYLPVDRYLAGLTLLLAFYLVTGLLHSFITRAYSSTLAVQYSAIAAIGLALVVTARIAGLA